jgi:hypothetical protein
MDSIWLDMDYLSIVVCLYYLDYYEYCTSMSDSKRLVRQDAVDIVLEAGLSRSRQVLAIQASRRQGPPFQYGPHGTEYDEDELKVWIAEQKAKKAKRGF